MLRLTLYAFLSVALHGLAAAPVAYGQADTTRVVVSAGEGVQLGTGTPVTGVARVRQRIRAIGGGAPAPVIVVAPQAGAAPGAVGNAPADQAALEAYLRRLERRIADLDRTVRQYAGDEPTVVVLPEGATPAMISAFRDSLSALPNVRVVPPSSVARRADADPDGGERRDPAVVFAAPTPEEVERVFLNAGLLRVLGVHFAFDEATLLPSARTTLDAVGQVLAANPDLRVEVRGHTDSIGAEDYNRGLSQRRAESVRDYLVRTFGIEAAQLVARGFGEAQPIATNANPTGRTLNRRVEFGVVGGGDAVDLP